MKILVTGAAGFIGFHLSRRLLKEGHDVVGLDIINEYYDVNLKYGRLALLGVKREDLEDRRCIQSKIHENFRFVKMDLVAREEILELFREEKFDRVCHLGAQAGVRYSIENPYAYIDSNVLGFLNILEGCRHYPVEHMVYASSSSVYGLNEKIPFQTSDNVDHPVSLYAATKKSGEMMAHAYSTLYGIPVTGLRFFSVYGPWGRPDMALFIFARNILAGKEIDVYSEGKCMRDFTYIDDIIEGISRVMNRAPETDENFDAKESNPSTSRSPYKIYNIGHSSPVLLMEFIETLEDVLGKKAKKNMMPMQPGDVPASWADVSGLKQDFDYAPATSVKKGIQEFVKWYLDYYHPGK
jgi:UDP-glucuronate 4-epimerase